MISFSDFCSRVLKQAASLGYDQVNAPDVNVELLVIDGDVAANGSKETMRRLITVGSSLPRYQYISLWLNPLHKRLYRFNNYGEMYLCTSVPQTYETDGGVANENGPLPASEGTGPTYSYTLEVGTAGGSGNNGVFTFPADTKFLLSV